MYVESHIKCDRSGCKSVIATEGNKRYPDINLPESKEWLKIEYHINYPGVVDCTKTADFCSKQCAIYWLITE